MTLFSRMTALASGVIVAVGLITTVASPSHAADCDALIQKCSRDIKNVRTEIRDAIKSCRGLRKCRREARREKRGAVGDCRQDKVNCRGECRRRYGAGRDFRKCVRNCRNDKRDCKRDARQDRREARQVCRKTYGHAACQKAHGTILKLGVKPRSCTAAAACIKKGV